MTQHDKKEKQSDAVKVTDALADVAHAAIFSNSMDKRYEISTHENVKLKEYAVMEKIEMAKLKENQFQFIVQSLASDPGYTYESAIESAYRFEQRHRDLSDKEIKFIGDRESLDYEKNTWAYSYMAGGLLVGVLIGYYLHKKNIL